MFWILESNKVGYKIVWCEEYPRGGESNCNWSLIADGLTFEEARAFKKRLG